MAANTVTGVKRSIVPPSQTESAHAHPHSPALVVGDTLFASGQVGLGPDGVPIADPRDQYVAAFENVKAVLTEAGFSFSDVVELVTYHTTLDHFDIFNEVKNRYVMGPVMPTWTAVGVAFLAIPGLTVEIKITALRS